MFILPIKCKVERQWGLIFFIVKIKVSIFFFWEIPMYYLLFLWRYICRLIKCLSSTSSERFLSLFLQQVMSLFLVLELVQTLDNLTALWLLDWGWANHPLLSYFSLLKHSHEQKPGYEANELPHSRCQKCLLSPWDSLICL